jgi:fused signal recognition particle receptor
MFGFFRRKPVVPPPPQEVATQEIPLAQPLEQSAPFVPYETPSPAPAASQVPPEAPASLTWAQKLKQGLSKTRGNLVGLFSRTKIDEQLYEELESALIASDSGYATTQFVLTELKEVVRKQRLESSDQVRQALALILTDLLRPLEGRIDIDRVKPLILMMTGVNGAGKTTSIGKLTHHLRGENKSILLAAADTFRAAVSVIRCR